MRESDCLYPELKQLARSRLRRSGSNTLLETAGLVNEAYLRVAGGVAMRDASPEKFLAYAARTMRSVVIDMVRERQAFRRGGDLKPVTLDTAIIEGLPAAEDTPLRIDEDGRSTRARGPCRRRRGRGGCARLGTKVARLRVGHPAFRVALGDTAKARSSFLKKRSKKLLFVWLLPFRIKGKVETTKTLHGSPSLERPQPNPSKVFASFFQKRRPCFRRTAFTRLPW